MHPNASLLKRMLALVYDGLILLALWLCVTWLFLMVFGDAADGIKRMLLQLLLWFAAGAYFVTCWCRSGQTLASQAWNIQLVDSNYQPLTVPRAVQRYISASCSLLCFGLGFFWALLDQQQLFLHDRLLGTRLVSLA